MAWRCPRCAYPVADDAVAACPVCATARPSPPGADAARRDLAMEAHVSAIALWHRIQAVVGLVAVVLGVPALIIMSGGEMGSMEHAVIAIVFVMVAGASIGYFFIGRYLGRYYDGARIAAAVLIGLALASSAINLVAAGGRVAAGGAEAGPAAMLLLLVAVAIAWDVAKLWALYNARSGAILTAEYRAVVARTPQLAPPTFRSPFFWLPLVGIGLALAGGALAVLSIVRR